jgi:ATP-dependent DNA helicase RecG
VGVNVPNATIIVIEGAERFGLAQIHQLRGRVLRGTHQAYCYLYADAKSEKTVERLRAVVEAKNGFELAERDLAQRGGGGLTGEKQWGVSDLGMDAIRNLKLVEAARMEAEKILKKDPTLTQHPLLASYTKKHIHLE